ncbi:MAG: hypothetical protein Q4C54_05430 [Clostridia bacterium]|nr:hypothetical protein [Clostridia bacterium]
MKRFFAGLLMIAALVCLCAFASAADDPIKVEMEMSQSSFSGPKDITVSIKVTNVGDGDLPGPVTLYYPSGKMIEEFGSPTLAVGASQHWSGTVNVTKAMLESGKLTFQVRYSYCDDNGEITNKKKNFYKKISYTGEMTNVEINRVISPSMAGKGQEVTITYEIVNAGPDELTNVTIKEDASISKKKGVVGKIVPGGKATYNFTVKMGTKDLKTEGTITYKVNGKQKTVKKEAAIIKYGEVHLSATLTADRKGAQVGETVKLTLTMKNSGTEDLEQVKVTDPVLGEIATGLTIKAGEKQVSKKEITLNQNQEHRFTVDALLADGTPLEVATETVILTAVDPTQVIDLSVSAKADRDTVYMLPGTVKFTVAVTNNGEEAVKNVSVYAIDTKLYTFPAIEPGETREFVRDVSVSMAGQYGFNARCKNALDETVRFESNTVYVGYAQPTPVPTEAPIITPPAPVYVDIPTEDDLPESYNTIEKALGIGKTVAMVIAGFSALIVLIGVAGRLVRRSAAAKAMDQLELSDHADYDHSHTKHSRMVEDDGRGAGYASGDEAVDEAANEQPEQYEQYEPGEEAQPGEGDVMAEALARIYSQAEQPAEAPQVQVEGEESEPATGRRRRSREQQE